MQKPRVPMASLYLAIVFIWCICGVCSASFSATDGPNIGYAIAYHRSEDEAGLPDKGNFFTGPPTRRILQSGDCSDNDNSDFAVSTWYNGAISASTHFKSNQDFREICCA